MRLYHWTFQEKLPSIFANGLRDSEFDAENGMERGVWFSEDKDGWNDPTRDALVAIDVPDDKLRAEWRSKINPVEWQIPSRFLRKLGIEPLRLI
jgi:hypothetical protein